ncbi:MAG: PLP-dependent aminotransferase family protein, partial [Acidimicrobiales bacterium]|nr:PLP-dependent aminotransferase family protein [Acidimicrobiales bacterium]
MVRSSAVDRLVDLLGDWSGGSGPLYRQLARAVAVAVARGELPGRARLPSERALASAIAVSRGVVVAAYDELEADGTIERRRGSGTFVAVGAATALPSGREGSALVGRLASTGDRPEVIDLSLSVLLEPEGLPDASIHLAALAAEGPDGPAGSTALRTRIAERLGGIGLATTVDQVVVTTGAQQAIAVAIGCWVRPGDLVVVDDPTYPGVLPALAAAGAEVVGVPVDRDGIRLGPLRDALDRGPALAYLQSGPHSPTGGRLSDHRRRAVAAEVVERRIPVVEDVALFALDWSGGREVPPLAAHAPDHPVALVGSYAKRFWSGLRVGFVRAPAPLAERFARVKAVSDLGSSAVGQAMALALLDHPSHEEAVAARNATLAARAELLATLVRQRLDGWEADVPDGGLSLWVRLPRPVAARFAEVVLRHGVAVA